MVGKKARSGRKKLDMPTQQKSLRIPEDAIKLAEKYDISISKVAVDGIRNEVDKIKISEFLSDPRMIKYRNKVKEYMKNVKSDNPDFEVMADDASSFIDAYIVSLNTGDTEQLMAIKFELRTRHPAIYDLLSEFEEFVSQHPEKYDEILKTENDNLLIIQKVLEQKKKLQKEIH